MKTSDGLKNIWDKLTDAEKEEISKELNKILQEEFDREFLRKINEDVISE